MMDSMNLSSMNKPVASKEAPDSPEESGWTSYFEDFSKNNREDSFCSSFGSSSLVSDAASGAAWKISHNNHALACSSIGGSPNIPKNLRFKKTRTKKISVDDSLEDTASSPVNSPKVSELERIDMYQKKADAHIINSSLGMEAASDHYKEMPTDDNGSRMDFNGKNDCTDLKRSGLCLVPLSMLVNYLG